MAPAKTASEKRCYYELLGLSRDCSTDAIRGAYKKLALQRHPDKLMNSGVSEAEATSQFQELAEAYETLSDPEKRSYYDFQRTLFDFAKPSSFRKSQFDKKTPPSFTCFTDFNKYFRDSVYKGFGDGKHGFYRVYEEVFRRVYDCEIDFVRQIGLNVGVVEEMPSIGGLDSDYDQVNAFYAYWLGFSTVMDFCWVDDYDVKSVANGKMRKLARREYNDTLRRLAEFVKSRDKRVVDVRRKREEERKRKFEAENERRKQAKKDKLGRAMRFEWDEEDWKKKEERKVFNCVLCGKKFKSEKQLKNHEQSKKHMSRSGQQVGSGQPQSGSNAFLGNLTPCRTPFKLSNSGTNTFQARPISFCSPIE